MIRTWHTAIKSNHNALSIVFFLIPNREKHKISSLYLINVLCLTNILWRMQNSMTFRDMTKILEKMSSLWRVVLDPNTLEVHSPVWLGILWWKFLRTAFCFCFVLFCLLCQGIIQKEFKFIDKVISARMIHAKELINIIISLQEEKLLVSSSSSFPLNASLETLWFSFSNSHLLLGEK